MFVVDELAQVPIVDCFDKRADSYLPKKMRYASQFYVYLAIIDNQYSFCSRPPTCKEQFIFLIGSFSNAQFIVIFCAESLD